MNRKAVFLDRDGVINKEKDYVHTIQDFEFHSGIFELCNFFKERKYLIFIITNQAGIAKGKYRIEDLITLNDWIVQNFQKRSIKIQEIFYCPHHPQGILEQYSFDCECRKPKPGMILNATEKYKIDLNQSILIGDKKSDILAGLNAGIPNNFLLKTHPREDYDSDTCGAKVFNSLEILMDFLSRQQFV